ncbi:MAG: exodeoxyribonuclease V subunit alpha [Thiohalorhabdus sp.]|uniref:exodeoxyribonuclease V subunit alpha n=1 Tax=Thiohalorhabdus sp. TaxID=3094134 RepID=UPI00397F6E9D
MWETLEALRGRGALDAVDVELARLLAEHDPAADWPVLLGTCLASHAPQQGDTCLDLAARAGRPLPEGEEPLATAPDRDHWRAALAASALVGGPGDFRPLILEGDRLYLQRYWDYEARIAADLRGRAAAPARPVDADALRAALERLFPDPPAEGPDWQRVAAAVAALRPLTLITGGPGTGKTTTVARLLAALLEQPEAESLRIALAAPTGKAAARMQEAIRHAKAELALGDDLKACIPEEARTLHRLLGSRMGSTQFRHHRDNPLPFDVVVVDEASMVDVALFAKLLDAVPHGARLVILGDRDQLAPVEAGAVLGEVAAAEPAFTPEFARALASLTGAEPPAAERPGPLADTVVALRRPHRFGDDGGLGPLVRAVKAGDADRVLAVLDDPAQAGVERRPLPQEAAEGEALIRELAAGFAGLIEAAAAGDSEAAFRAYRAFGVLDAMRHGPWGTEALNRRLETALRRQGRIPAHGDWYPGRPVLVTHNDYRLGLFNGDVGIAIRREGGLRVVFETPDGGHRALAPGRLPNFEPAFALTVHKSQGSELERAELLLPESASALNSRELLYTGISRAKRGLTLRADEATLRRAVTQPLERASGLGPKMAADAGKPAPDPA